MGIKDKAQDMMGKHGDKLEQGVDRAEEQVDEKTGGRFSDQLRRGADQIKDRFGEQNR